MELIQPVIDVHTGDVKVAAGDAKLRSTGIGSCITVVAIDPEKQIGGMAHVMLPGTAPQNAEKKTNYAYDAIDQLLNEMIAWGADHSNLEICLVGAGNVLEKEDDTICDSNIESVTSILSEMEIPVRASVLGGIKRKAVFLDIQTGAVSYTQGDEREKLL